MATYDVSLLFGEETKLQLGDHGEPRIFDVSVSVPSGGGGGGGVTYRMRGYDTTLTTTVFWSSDHVDSTAADYGGPGPVTNIVVQKQVGTV
jgi:hypothetical protein